MWRIFLSSVPLSLTSSQRFDAFLKNPMKFSIAVLLKSRLDNVDFVKFV